MTTNTKKVKARYTYDRVSFPDIDPGEARDFDEWLAEEIRKAKEQAWDEGYLSGEPEEDGVNPYAKDVS